MGDNQVKIVVVHHQNNKEQYVFSVPYFATLNAGDVVICDTRMGDNQVGYCITPSYVIDKEFLHQALGVKSENLKPVKGIYTPHYYKTEEEYEAAYGKKTEVI